MLAWLFWNPPREAFTIPFLNLPVMWYGVLFAMGFIVGYFIFLGLLKRYFYSTAGCQNDIKNLSVFVADKVTVIMVLATLIGARLGHVLFYDDLQPYLLRPWKIFMLREGGLASHGAAIAIIAALIFLARYFRRKKINLSWLSLLDLIAIPTACAAVFIRCGNFINQEILGRPTIAPWAVVFLSPADGSMPIARHPAQLYEALAYLLIFGLLLFLSYRRRFLWRSGLLIGLLLALVFSARFIVEFFKEEQSVYLGGSALCMGHYLSLPFIILGLILLLPSYRVKTL